MTLESRTTHLSLVVPLYNESQRLPRLEEGLREFIAACRICSFEIILVNDGSTDDTASGLPDLRDRLLSSRTEYLVDIGIVALPVNKGKGGALQAGIQASHGLWVLTLDVDMSTRPTELFRWQELDPSLDLGSAPDRPRFYMGAREHPDSQVQDTIFRRCIGRGFNLLVQWITGLEFDDTQCGFKLYPGDLARQLFASLVDRGWAHDVEILRQLVSTGIPIIEMPVRWHTVGGGSIRCRVDGPKMLLAVIRLRLRDGWRGQTLPARSLDRFWQRAGWAVLGALLLMTLLCFRHYGAAWDETIQDQYGRYVLNFYTSWGKDTSALTYSNLRYYGGLFDGMVAWMQQCLPWKPYDTRHLLNGLMGWLGILGTWKLARHLAGPRAAFLAIGLLALEPSFMGHRFFNPKDIPFAAGYVWSIYYLARCIGRFPNIPNGLILKTGIAFGLTVSFRVGGVLVIGYLLVAAVFFLARSQGFAAPSSCRPLRNFLPLCRSLVRIGILTYGLTLIFWPWALVHPLRGPLEALREVSRFGGWAGPILLAGKEYYAADLPVFYLPLYFLVKLPELVLIGLVAGGALAMKHRRTPEEGNDAVSVCRWVFLGLALVFPVFYAVVTRSVMYDTHRHFLFVIPLACVVAGSSFNCLFQRLNAARPTLAMVTAAIVLAAAVEQIVTLVRLHPYEYVYYNHLAGGIRGAAKRYELDYWGTSYREAVAILTRYLDRTEPGRRPSTGYRVTVFGPRETAALYFPPCLILSTDVHDADFYISFTRFRGDAIVRGKLIGSVSRMDVDLAVVKDLRQIPRDQRLPKWWDQVPAGDSPQRFSPPL